jgi:O-acetylhomoserine (thiol)-lyase
MNAFLLNLGLESLHVRIKRHSDSALAIAQYLEAHPQIAWVNFPALPSSPDYALTQKYLPNGTCGVISFGVKGGREAASAFMKALKLVAIETHVADARSCCLHPATATHRQLSDEELVACGVSADLVRLSVGLEDPEDLIADIEQALKSIQ